ncbi:hypothetical protein [Corynebacterium bovis]|uniref:hypothetical protein n=1 Tax=Corynebacterium bovis TaxID=36808 RepID=UPI000F64DBDC|nr:hypothetical protein [Corynebacterium bovis]
MLMLRVAVVSAVVVVARLEAAGGVLAVVVVWTVLLCRPVGQVTHLSPTAVVVLVVVRGTSAGGVLLLLGWVLCWLPVRLLPVAVSCRGIRHR